MIAWINSRFVAEQDAVVSVFDRGFLYGDGLFETLRVLNGAPVHWQAHWDRLMAGASALGIALSWTPLQTQNVIQDLLSRNALQDGILRITLTRGRGPRGYSPKGTGEPTMVLTLHPAAPPGAAHPDGLALAVASYRVLAGDPLLQIKSGSQLIRVVARAEAEASGAGEALMLNHHGRVAEAASANIFWLRDNILHTPPVSEGALPGITRATLMRVCPGLGMPCVEAETKLEDLWNANGVYLTNSGWGIVEASSLNGSPLARSASFFKRVSPIILNQCVQPQ